MHIIIDEIYVGIVKLHFSQIWNRVMALDFVLFNILSKNEKNLTKFCIYINIDNI